VLGHELIVPSFPEYYPHPNEAKLGCGQVTTRFYTFLQAVLEKVKNPHSKVTLVRKGTLLQAAIRIVEGYFHEYWVLPTTIYLVQLNTGN
jgi:hypothetical protein